MSPAPHGRRGRDHILRHSRLARVDARRRPPPGERGTLGARTWHTWEAHRGHEMLTLRPFNIGPPVYAHLLDSDALEGGQSIGRLRGGRGPKPGREWFWSLTIAGAHGAGVLAWGSGVSLEAAKAAFRASL